VLRFAGPATAGEKSYENGMHGRCPESGSCPACYADRARGDKPCRAGENMGPMGPIGLMGPMGRGERLGQIMGGLGRLGR